MIRPPQIDHWLKDIAKRGGIIDVRISRSKEGKGNDMTKKQMQKRIEYYEEIEEMNKKQAIKDAQNDIKRYKENEEIKNINQIVKKLTKNVEELEKSLSESSDCQTRTNNEN